MEYKYDVFISYSRKDYIENDSIISGNPISAIQELFDQHNVKYWFDREGIYSGQEFIEVISNAITYSKMLVFVSSKHSNNSLWTAGEIFEALDGGKLIIPVRIDDCPYNKKFRMLIRPLDYIDYYSQPNTALPQLLRAINIEKERLAQIEADERNLQLAKEMEIRKEATKKEIREVIKELYALTGQQEHILKEIYAKNKYLGITTKQCPVCKKEVTLQSQFCTQCGWQFAMLFGMDENDVLHCDESQLSIARDNWAKVGRVTDLEEEKDRFEKLWKECQLKVSNLEQIIKDLSKRCNKDEELLSLKDTKIASLNEKINSFSLQTEQSKRGIINKKEEKKFDVSNKKEKINSGNDVFSARENVFVFIRSFCNNKNIKESSTMVSAKVKYRKLSEALKDTYHVDLNEFALQSFSSVGELVDTIWQEIV